MTRTLPPRLAALAPHLHDPLPGHRGLYYGGAWHEPAGGYAETLSPVTGETLGPCAEANAADVDAAVAAAHAAFKDWRGTKPVDRGKLLRRLAAAIRAHGDELIQIDAVNMGGPCTALRHDVDYAATHLEFFAGLVTELKGDTSPQGDGALNITMREPLGVCARIVAYNHPLMFIGARIAAPLAAGNTVIMKPPVQAPLSAYRLMEILGDLIPPGVVNVLSGGLACGEALVAHPGIPSVSLIGSVPTGRAIARGAADRLKHVLLELGGKNAMIIYPDADIDRAIEAAVRGMNFTFAGQSCASTTRIFAHAACHDRVLDGIVAGIARFRPGPPTDPATTMGALISARQRDLVMGFIASGLADGARLVAGGRAPTDPRLAQGYFIEPTVFADVTMDMRIAREEIFGPVLSVLRWDDENAMFDQVNGTEYGLTASIFTSDLATAHRGAARVEAGYVWINNAGTHFHGTPFGGTKLSGVGREESIEEMLAFTQLKNVHITL